MLKITNDGLTRSGTGCFIAVPIYGNSGHQRVKLYNSCKWVCRPVVSLGIHSVCWNVGEIIL